MTQFAPPPPPYEGMSAYAPTSRKRWSATAIAAFVFSLLICLPGLNALLGLILGTFGIVATSGGERRGRGLAIAAIPISLITGALSFLIFAVVFGVARSMPVIHNVEVALKSEGTDAEKTLIALRPFLTDDFQRDVDSASFLAWTTKIQEKHGKLLTVKQEGPPKLGQTPEGDMSLSVDGRFVNGPASITAVIKSEGLWNIRLHDIYVAGVSPREKVTPTPGPQ